MKMMITMRMMIELHVANGYTLSSGHSLIFRRDETENYYLFAPFLARESRF